jgi:dihydrofolate reductase
VRPEPRLLKVLIGLSEDLNLSLGDLQDGCCRTPSNRSRLSARRRWRRSSILGRCIRDANPSRRRIHGQARCDRIHLPDGVVEGPGGSGPFERAGWTNHFSRGPDADRFKVDETMAADAQLLGRVTYEEFAAAWPSREGEFADYFNSMPKYVLSSTLKDPVWNNTTVIRGDLDEEIRRLKSRYERDILVFGSPQLAQALIENDLVDALHLFVHPVIVGAGKRLFDGTSGTKRLRLAESRTFGDGVHLLVYHRA